MHLLSYAMTAQTYIYPIPEEQAHHCNIVTVFMHVIGINCAVIQMIW